MVCCLGKEPNPVDIEGFNFSEFTVDLGSWRFEFGTNLKGKDTSMCVPCMCLIAFLTSHLTKEWVILNAL